MKASKIRLSREALHRGLLCNKPEAEIASLAKAYLRAYHEAAKVNRENKD